MFLYSLDHRIYSLLHTGSLVGLTDLLTECHIVLAGDYEETCDHQALSLRAFRHVLGGLEALIRIPREAVQVQTVVPVGTTNQRQHVRTKVVDDMIRTRLIVEGHHLIEDREVACLLDISHGTEDKPAGVIVETAADIVVTTLGQGLVLVVATTIRELCRSDVDDALTSTWRYLMNKAHEVLIGITEAHATTYTTLEETCTAREVKGDHALVLVPDVHHAVELVVACLHLIDVQQCIPVLAEGCKSLIHLLGGVELGDEGMRLLLVDHLRCLKLLILFILDITQQEDEVLALTGLEGYFDIVRSNRTPTMGMRVAGLTLHDCIGISKLVIKTNEGLTVGIEALDRGIHMIESVVVTTLTILGLMIDRRSFDFHFTRREVTLEVLHVGSSIPETPLLEREELQLLHFGRLVLQCELLYLSPLLQGHKEEYRGLDTVLTTCDTGVAHAMTALVEVEWRLARFPTWIPHGIAILDVEITPAVVHRHVVVAIAGDTAELGILVEAVATSGVRDEGEKILVAQIVDPGPRSLRVCDDILAVLIVEMTVTFLFHKK